MKKLDELKRYYVTGGKSMKDNMPNKPIEITDADIDNNIQKYEQIVIDCWAPWCGPCGMIHHILEDLSKEMQGKIVFGKLNVDYNTQTASKYGIMSIPTLLIFKKGKLVDKMVGVMTKQMLKEKLTQHI